MIKNIIFDIGNVLMPFGYRPFFESFGYDEETVERLSKATAQTPDWNELDRGVLSYEEVLGRFVENDSQLEEIIQRVFADLHGILGVYDYTESWIKQLKEAGYGVYYLSNFFQKADEDCKDLMGFLELTDGGILSYKDKVTKPDRQIYELLLERFGLKAEECVFLDDTKKNIDGARAVGIHGILFHDREQAVAELQKLGVKTE
ncbi:MAG: HAD family phosphatase [Lachnospiraceae bacterium]|nr:HAD family phosphatase [Lachnospiraceae bacterium]